MKNLQEQILKQLSLINYDRNKILSEQGSSYWIGTNVATEPISSDLWHIFLPIASILTMWAPPLSVAFEGLDAGLYLAEGRYYEAGLAAAFMLIPGGAFGQLSKTFSQVEKKALGELLEKQAKGEVVEYTAKQKKLLEELGKEGTQKILKKRLIVSGIKQTLKEVNSITILHRFIYNLVAKGYLPAKFLTTMGLQIGVTFFTWDAIGKGLGLCNPAPLKALLEAKQNWLKKIGEVGQYLQPFTDSCDQVKAFQAMLQVEQESENMGGTKAIILDRLKAIRDAGNTLILSVENFSNVESLETLSVQVALKALGLDKYSYTTLVPGTNEKKYVEKPYDPNDPYIKFMKGLGNSEESLKQMWKIKQQSDKKEAEKANKVRYVDPITNRVFYFDSYEDYAAATKNKLNFGREVGVYGQVNYIQNVKTEIILAKFKWGYYDEETKKVVEEFQMNNNLSVDGRVGVNTAKKLIEKVNGLGSISSYGTKVDTFSETDKKRLQNNLIQRVKELNKKPTPDASQLDQLPPQEQILKLEKELEKNITDDVINMGENVNWAQELGIK